MSEEDERDFGPQPLTAMMEKWAIASHDLVESSDEQLTHKQVQRARSGRKLTLKMMQKVARAWNLAATAKLDKAIRSQFVAYQHKELFSYAKGFNAEKPDANEEIVPR